jgi:uncharacterized phage protein (TIGR01671 family)
MNERQLKFRAWDTESQTMHNVYELRFKNDTYTGYLFVEGVAVYRDKIIPMQFIGLVDTEGEMIYEGDIVTSEVSENVGGVIEYCIPNACFLVREKSGLLIPIDVKDGTNQMKQTRVEGNVYEHKISDIIQ